MTVLDEKTREMQEKIIQWKECKDGFHYVFKEDTPQEILDLEIEYKKRIRNIQLGCDCSFE